MAYRFLPQIEEAVSSKRKDVFTLFKSIAKMCVSETTAFVAGRLEVVIANPQTGFQEVEIIVTLLYQLGEGASEEYTKPGCGVLGQMAAALMQAQLPHARHRLVALAVLEASVRYCRVIQARPSLAPPVLGALLDDRGMGHASEAVSTRACYLFQRLVRYLRSSFAPVVETVLSGLEPHLARIASTPRAQASSGPPGGFAVLSGPKGTQGKGPMGAASYLDDRMYAFEVRARFPRPPRAVVSNDRLKAPSPVTFQSSAHTLVRGRLPGSSWAGTTSRQSASSHLYRVCSPPLCGRSRVTPMLP
jgi:exportin-T